MPTPKLESIATLMGRTFPEPRFLVPGLVPESGLVVLAGAQKLGKSWFALQLSLAVALSGVFLGHQLEGGDVLYLALEDNPRRMQSRVKLLLEQDENIDLEALERFEYLHEIHPLDLGGIEHLRTWLEGHPDARLVVVDVLKRALSGRLDFNDYGQVTTALSPLQRLSHEFNVPILVVTHTRKGLADGGDPFDRVLGSTAIASVADATLVMMRDRMQHAATLAVTGRDLAELELALIRNPDNALWSLNGDGNPQTVALTSLHHQIVSAIAAGINTNKALCDYLGKKKSHISNLLRTLTERGHLEQQAGVYISKVHNGSQPSSQVSQPQEMPSEIEINPATSQGSLGSQGVIPDSQDKTYDAISSQSAIIAVNSCEPFEEMRPTQGKGGSVRVVNLGVNHCESTHVPMTTQEVTPNPISSPFKGVKLRLVSPLISQPNTVPQSPGLDTISATLFSANQEEKTAPNKQGIQASLTPPENVEEF